MNTVHICMICDDNYVMPTGVAIQSLIDSKKTDVLYHIHIISSEISHKSEDIIKLLECEEVKIDLVRKNAEQMFSGFHQYKDNAPCVASIAALLKFMISDIFVDLDKILYIDGDIISRISLDEIYNINIDNYYAAVVADSGSLYSQRGIIRKVKTYFNSGVMLLNAKKLREEKVSQLLINTKKRLTDFSLMDQDVFNIIFDDKILLLPIKYNFLAINLSRANNKWKIDDVNNKYSTCYSSKEELFSDFAILHFSSKDKPWKVLEGDFSNYWISSYVKSPLFENSLYRGIDDDIKKIYRNLVDYIRNPKAIISMTSYPARIELVHHTIKTLLYQDIPFKKLVLWLAESQFPRKERDLPEKLLALCPRGLSIEWCEDIRSYKKLIPALKKYPDDIIVTADDDIIYPRDWLRRLVHAYSEHPDMIHCLRAHRIAIHNGNILPYQRWNVKDYNVSPSFLNFFTGVGGVVYHSSLLYRDIMREDIFTKLCPDADDIWFWGMSVLQGTKINFVNPPIGKLNYVPHSQDGNLQLWKKNVLQNENDIKLKAFLDAYPSVRKILIAENKRVRVKETINRFSKPYYKEKNKNNKSIYIFGLPVFRKMKSGTKKRISILGIQLYKSEQTDSKKRISIFGIPVYSKKTSGFRTIRRLLFFKFSKFNWKRSIESDLHQLIESVKFLQSDITNNRVTHSMEIKKIRKITEAAHRSAAECVWALTYNSVSSQSEWLKNTTFAPGRWALGYPALYIMFRVLNEARPKSILELGLGQSTRMIAQYVAANADVEHIVVEHDENWINFFKNDFSLSLRTNILKCDRSMESYKDAEEVRVFVGLSEKLDNKKFDFIFIDAPLGGDMKVYSRIDVLKMIPECLADNFIIMLDDTNRSGELNTLKEMMSTLEQNNISFVSGTYRGDKETSVICSHDLGFFSSL